MTLNCINANGIHFFERKKELMSSIEQQLLGVDIYLSKKQPNWRK